MAEPADPARRAAGAPHTTSHPRSQRERITLSVTLLAVIAVPGLVAIWLGYHSLAFYGVMGAAIYNLNVGGIEQDQGAGPIDKRRLARRVRPIHHNTPEAEPEPVAILAQQIR